MIRELESESQRRRAVPILEQLWSDATPAEVLDWTAADDYTLFGRFEDGELVGVAGVLVREVLHHARHAWLYDLVVDESARGRGHGAALVDHVESWARDRDCEYVALASPAGKTDVHEYYESLDYQKWGYIVEKEL